MIKLEFINHSSVCFTKDEISLTIDPWLEGLVFNNSWNLLSKTSKKSFETVKNSKFICFSHEHPDHFYPPNIKLFGLNKNYIFQKTKDKRIINFLKKFSPNVKELSSNEVLKLGDEFTIKIMPFQDLDSLFIIKMGNKTILNLNDCHIKSFDELNEIIKNTGKVDILMAQFSYAIGKSNKNQKNIRQEISLEILNNLNNTISFFKPKFFIPFASFCYFCREDNFYLNDSLNKIDFTINFLKKANPEVNFLCFYPGDEWNLDSIIDNTNSINKYLDDYKKISSIELEKKPIKFETLKKSANEFIQKTLLKNNMFKFYEFLNPNFYKINFKLTDTNLNLHFNFKDGLTKIDKIDYSEHYCELASDSLNQLFTSGYGYDALMIGGRFETNDHGNKCLNKIFKFQTKNYQNHYYNFKDIIPKLFKKFSKYSRINPNR